ncbi:MAG TPA: MFS transporter [Pirellulales bacterium]|jgi:MFS family permease|nr:MFS transporter [Pirellulales bacterium]
MSEATDRVDRFGDRLMTTFWRKPAATLAERTRRRVTLHLVPYLFFLYILAYVDRMNIAVAGLAMTDSPAHGGLGFNEEIVGIGAGIFFWGYWILEIPSTLWVERRGARWVFVRILILWGLVAAVMGSIGTPIAASLFGWLPHLSEDVGLFSGATAFINRLSHDAVAQFYFLRFMLGFFEGGFFPSVIVYLSHWFRQEDRAKALASFALAMPLSSVIGYTFSAFFLNGLEGWRWIFVVEGILPILAGFTTIFLLPDRPANAKWLPHEERDWLVGELSREHQQKVATRHVGWQSHVFMIVLLTAVYFCTNVTAYGLSTFMPKIMKSQLPALPFTLRSWLGLAGKMNPATLETRMKIMGALVATLPYYVSIVAVLINGWHSDRSRERAWHAAIPMAIASLGVLLASVLLGHPLLAMPAFIFIVGSCVYTHIPAFWPIPTMLLGASAAASAIGFINMVGNIGGMWGPTVVGKAADTSIADALLRIAPWSIGGATILIAMDVFRRWRMRRRAQP